MQGTKKHLFWRTPKTTETMPGRCASWFTLAVILVLALLIRTVPLTHSHFWDETVYLQHAKVIVDGRTNYDEFESRPPVLPLVYALGFTIWDHVYMANLV